MLHRARRLTTLWEATDVDYPAAGQVCDALAAYAIRWGRARTIKAGLDAGVRVALVTAESAPWWHLVVVIDYDQVHVVGLVTHDRRRQAILREAVA